MPENIVIERTGVSLYVGMIKISLMFLCHFQENRLSEAKLVLRKIYRCNGHASPYDVSVTSGSERIVSMVILQNCVQQQCNKLIM